jgi:hypothetical protein
MPTVEMLNLLMPIIASSSLLIGSLAFWAFYRAFKLILMDFYYFFKFIFIEEEKLKLNRRLKKYLSIFTKLINKKARLRNLYLINISDKIFSFDTKYKDDNKHIFSYWSSATFARSWILSLIYLVVMLLILGYEKFDANILWQFIVLLVYYIFIFYILVAKNISFIIKLIFLTLVILFAFVGAFAIAVSGLNAVLVMDAIADVDIVAVVMALASIDVDAVVGATWVIDMVSFVGAFAFSFAVGVSGTVVVAFVVGVAVVGRFMSAVFVVMTVAFVFAINNDGSTILTQNIFQLLPTLKYISPNDTVRLFIVFFFIMPMSNAFIDSLSLSVSRYEFQKLLNKKTYSFPFFLKVSLVDFLYALVFKLLILGVLYTGALLFEKTGGTFQVNNIIIYFNYMTNAILENGTFSFLFTGSTNTMITLMVSTTLLPTIIHFVSILLNTIWALLENSIQLLGLFLKANVVFFSTVMSFLLLFLLLFFMIFYILRII